jgi:hypothetical protein
MGAPLGSAFQVTADNAVDHETGAVLKVPHSRLKLGAKHAVDREPDIWRAAQCALETPDHIAAGAKLDRWLTWIRHRLLLSGISLKSAGAKRWAANIRALCRISYRHIEGAEDIEGEHPTDAPSRMPSLGQGGDK